MTVIRLSAALLVALATATVGAHDGTMLRSVIPQSKPIERRLQGQTIGEIAAATADLSDLFGAFETLNLSPFLSNPLIAVTVFAPVNSAFAALDEELLQTLFKESFSRHLTEVLLYHVTDDETLSTGLSNGREFTMVNQGSGVVGVIINGDIVLLSDSQGVRRANVIGFDILASNGVVHLIDNILLPSFLFRRTTDLGENYSTLISLVVLVGLDADLRVLLITLFAPNNLAFAALPASTVEALTSPEGQDTLREILSYHVLATVITSDKLEGVTGATTAQGSPVTISVLDGGTVRVNDATVVQADILSRNGVTHGIDRVLIVPPPPSSPTSSPTDSPTRAPITSTPTSGPTSGPTSAPITSTPTSGPTSGPASGPTTVSPTSAPVAALTSAPSDLDCDKDLFGLAVDTPALSTLVAAVTAADLASILSSPLVELTVFAPTDDAFAALDQEVLARLLTPPFKMHLTELLLYHVVDGETLSTDLSDGLDVTMVSKEVVTVGVNATTVSLSNSQGVSALAVAVDIAASNGVAHAINGVLLPSFVYTTVIDLGESYSTLMTAIELVDLVDTLKAGTFTLFAPTNIAFAMLGQETLDFLTSPDGKDTLTDILKFHVISTVITSDKLLDGGTVVTVQGGSVTIGITDGTVMVDDATVINDDMLAINGVTHGIDTVLMLPIVTSVPTMAPSTSAGVALGTSFLGLLAMAMAVAF
jgi:transforming growth factor-beta-induced protein